MSDTAVSIKQKVLDFLYETDWRNRKIMSVTDFQATEEEYLEALEWLVTRGLIKTSSRWCGQWWITKKGKKVQSELKQTSE